MKDIVPGLPLGGVGVPFKGFSRYRVLDFSRLLPGPYATQILSDMGMKVTCVEFPRFPELSRSLPPMIGGVGSLYWLLNRGKRRVILAPRSRRLLALARSAHIVVEGFRPGVMERLGLGYAALKRSNPRLVYCSLGGYPAQGRLGSKAGHDLNFLAASGFLGLSPSPAMPPVPLADLAGSMAAVSGTLAALLEGRGRHVRVSIAQATHSLLALPLAWARATGRDPGRARLWWNGAHPFYRLYAAKDGAAIAVGAVEKGFALALLDFLGLPALKALVDDPESHEKALAAALAASFRGRTGAQWRRALAATDFCVTPVLTLAEAAATLWAPATATAGPRRAARRRPPAPRPAGRRAKA